MKEFAIQNSDTDQLFSQLKECLQGQFKKTWGESFLEFNTDLGEGSLRAIDFDWGVSLIDFELKFNEEMKLVFNSTKSAPIEFIFISQGSIGYSVNNDEEYTNLEQLQNIIISPSARSSKTFLFPKNEVLKINIIRINRKEYLKKKNNNVNYLNTLLLSLFNDTTGELGYHHGGRYSLKIAEEVKNLKNTDTTGILRTLTLEGRLYLILSLQLMELQQFEEEKSFPDSLSKHDIKKIHELTDYIIDNISHNISIDKLCSESGLSPKKLQTGFKILYSKTINEYVRQMKLEISKDYLKNTDMSVSEVVYAIGIRSRSYFSKIFSEAYGILPTEYRKQLKNNKSLKKNQLSK